METNPRLGFDRILDKSSSLPYGTHAGCIAALSVRQTEFSVGSRTNNPAPAALHRGRLLVVREESQP